MTTHSMLKACCALVIALGVSTIEAQNVPARMQRAVQSEGTWPQRFDVGGPESTSFGFAVTQPGPIQLVVQWQGPPLKAELRGPHSLVQTGQGRIQLDYQVTPADLQKSLLWQVSLSLATPAPVAAVGSIELQRPPVDSALVQSHLQTIDAARAARAAAQPRQPTPQFTAKFENALQASVTRFNQGQLARRADAERQFGATLRQPANGQVTSRAVPSGAVVRSEMRDTALLRAQVPPPSAGEVPVATRPLAPAVATVPAPVISAVSPAAGQPGDRVVITGSGFGASRDAVQGQVRFLLNPGKDLVAPIDGWTDTQILTRVPAASGVVPAQASISVTNQGAIGSASGFQFTPVLGTRTWYLNPFPPGARITKPGTMVPVGIWPGYDYSKHPTGAVEHKNPDAFFGHRDNDELLRGVVLQNGWVLEDVIFALYEPYHPTAAGAYLASVNKGSNTPIVNVRWWTDGYVPMFQSETEAQYTLAVVIKGPADMPDGWLCGAAPCK